MWNLYANQERWLNKMASVVFFHAHPDDEALSTGGTMALMAKAGHRVILVVATRGEEGEPVEGILKDGEKLEDLSLIHISDPRDRTRSRMPSSA